MITQEMIEDAAVQYIMNNPGKPKFVLLDKKSYDDFENSFLPHERFKPETEIEKDLPKITKMHTSKAELQILKVDTDVEMFEVVG